MNFILRHKGLSQPILVSSEMRTAINADLRSGEGGYLIFGNYTLSRWGVEAIEPQDEFLAGDADNLARFDEVRCRWGFKQKRGEHKCSEAGCHRKARRDSPYIRPETWAKFDEAMNVPTLEAKADHVDKRTIVSVTEKSFRSGQTVLPTLVRFYRENPSQLSPDVRVICASFDGMEMSKVPRRSMADFSSDA